MQALDLYKSRKHSLIKLADGKEYKIPNEYTVEEVERLLELRAKQEELEGEQVANQDTQLKQFWATVFDQLEVIFGHYQPKVTSEYLRTTITHNEALEMLGFFQKYRHIAVKELLEEAEQSETPKKKSLAKASRELRDLRRMITFLVVSGFSLFDLRKLYIDELYEYYQETYYVKEKITGEVKEGTYAKIVNSNKSTHAEETVSLLRSQMFRSIANKNKKK